MAENFSLGITYWPRRVGYRWWSAFDRSETREELAHIAALGCDTVRFCLRWEDFQPQPQGLNSGAMQALEHALEAAYEAGLRVVAALFPAALDGSLHIPGWANRTNTLADLQRTARFGPVMVMRPAPAAPVLYEDAYHTNRTRDMFDDLTILDAQRYLVREVVGYFGSHPALWAWQPGEGLERVHKPGSAEAIHEWLGMIGEAIRAHDADARIVGVTSARGLATRPGPRPEHLADTCDLSGVAADPPEAPHEQPLHTTYVAYLHALTAALAGKPTLVSSLALPTAPDNHADWIADSAFGKPTRAYLGNAEEQASFVGETLERLRRAGARGAWLAAYADYPTELWRRPPLDRVTRARSLGIVDIEGNEKPAAAALRAFAAARHTVADVAPPLEADPERYWRDPQHSFVKLWREFHQSSE
jgi:hypothetical protein